MEIARQDISQARSRSFRLSASSPKESSCSLADDFRNTCLAYASEKKKTLVAGLGNSLAGDDGIGSAVIHNLKKEPLPESVSLMDAGVDALAILNELKGVARIILIDAADFGAQPGEWFIADEKELFEKRKAGSFSLHQLSALNLIQLSRILGYSLVFVLIGIQPEKIVLQEGLSDCAPLNQLVKILLEVCPETHTLRDPTRGGLSTTLNEISKASGVKIEIEETKIPIRTEVQAACNLLGIDPLYIANEGKFVAFVPEKYDGKALSSLRKHPLGAKAEKIGKVVAGKPGVEMVTIIGGRRPLRMLEGESLPRIC